MIRAFNVLRQYDESAVVDSWRIMQDRLQPGGTLVEGTCNEVGRVASWVTLDEHEPHTFTVSLRVADLELPSIVAERLPKALIHRNVPGSGCTRSCSTSTVRGRVALRSARYGPRQRWIATVHGMRDRGWPVLHGVTRWRLGELSVPWSAVAPA